MAFICYNKLCENEFDIIVSKKAKVQDKKINQSKLEVHGTYKKDERKTTLFEHVNIEDVINKAHLEEKLSKIEGHLPLLEKDYNEFKIH